MNLCTGTTLKETVHTWNPKERGYEVTELYMVVHDICHSFSYT